MYINIAGKSHCRLWSVEFHNELFSFSVYIHIKIFGRCFGPKIIVAKVTYFLQKFGLMYLTSHVRIFLILIRFLRSYSNVLTICWRWFDDDEVLVLAKKAMKKWLKNKTKGEDISAYSLDPERWLVSRWRWYSHFCKMVQNKSQY